MAPRGGFNVSDVVDFFDLLEQVRRDHVLRTHIFRKVFENPHWVPDCYDVGWHVLVHNCACTDYAVISNGYSWEDNCSCS